MNDKILQTAIADSRLTLHAKGLCLLLFSSNSKSGNLDDIYTLTSSDKILFVEAFKELAKYKYISLSNNKTDRKQTSIQQSIYSAIEDYTDDSLLQVALKQYADARLFPDKNSRFGQSEYPFNIDSMKFLLTSLDFIEYKVDAVNTSLEKQYFKFFELPKNTRMQNVESNTYTQEDIDEIKRRQELLEKEEVY